MASIIGLKLTLVEHDHSAGTATVKVEYQAYFNSVERQMDGLLFQEQISLWGADDVFDPDDFLYQFPNRIFAPSGVLVPRERQVTLGEGKLDEDDYWWLAGGESDEVYARVTIRPANMPSSRTRISNQIHHEF